MPEYLSPKVYVEEVDSGPKPIEGVSTSTVGLIGVTERGPVDIPILVTSAGEFQRWFGQSLNSSDFGDHCYLPHAIDGFFGNSGKRAYVTRILDTGAAQMATTDLFQEEAPPAIVPELLAAAPATATSIVITDALNITAPDWVRIGAGSDSEYRHPPAVPTANATNFVAPTLPLQLSHGTTTNAEHYTAATVGAAVGSYVLAAPLEVGATTATLSAPPGPPQPVPTVGQLLRVNDSATATNEELIYLADVGSAVATGPWVVTLSTPVQLEHVITETVSTYNAPVGAAGADVQALSNPVPAGVQAVLIVANGNFTTANDFVVFRDPTAARTEARRIGQLGRIQFAVGAYTDYGAGWRYEHLTTADSALAVITLDAAVAAGAVSLAVNNRNGLAIGNTIRIGNPTDAGVEYVVIRDLPNQSGSSPDPGRIILESALVNPHGGATPASLQIVCQQAPSNAGIQTQTGTLVLPVPDGQVRALLSNGFAGPPGINDLLQVHSPDGDRFLHRIGTSNYTFPFAPQVLTFVAPLTTPHAAGSPVLIRHELMTVTALDYGAWGNRLRIAAAPDASPRVRTHVRLLNGIIPPNHIRLDSPAGIEPGPFSASRTARATRSTSPSRSTPSIGRTTT